jgi:hypothetical protein
VSEGKRPGGLTALAVLNFVFGGFNALGFLGMAAMLALMNVAADAAADSEQAHARDEMVKAWREGGMPLFYFILVAMAVGAFLLIASGVGYLQQKKVLGRGFGNAYALVSIATALVSAAMVSQKVGGGFSIGTIVGLIYPVITLILLNGTFKHDLVR